MKKYILFSSFLILSLFLIGSFGIKPTNAMTVAGNTSFKTFVSGCKIGDLFSRTTGQSCEIVTVSTPCAAGDIYSSATGQLCSITTLPVGCTSTSGYSTTTGVSCSTTTTSTALTIPVISSMSPTSGPVGTQITITGSGFSSLSGLAAGGQYGVWLSGPTSSQLLGTSYLNNGILQVTNDNSLSVTIPSMGCPGAQSPFCSSNFGKNILPGNYVIYVENGNGNSNKIAFTITSTTGTCLASGLDSSTGLPCGCTSTSGYSTTTGVSCSGQTTTPTASISQVSNLQASVLTATPTSVNLSWSAATATNGINYYNIYRTVYPSQAAGAVATSSNVLIEQTTGLSYTDANLSTGYYYYTVSAIDTKGNMGPSSATSANITGTTTATSTLPSGCTSTSGFSSVDGSPCGVPIVTLSANPTSITSGGSSTLTWNSPNSLTCYNSWNGNQSTSGSFTTGVLSSTTNYTVNCTNSLGSSSASATVNVLTSTSPIHVCPAWGCNGPIPVTPVLGCTSTTGYSSSTGASCAKN